MNEKNPITPKTAECRQCQTSVTFWDERIVLVTCPSCHKPLTLVTQATQSAILPTMDDINDAETALQLAEDRARKGEPE